MRTLLLTLLLPLAQASAAPRLLVHGHRGCRALRPENTLAAFNEALRLGVDVFELDMILTKDDVVAVSHNKKINPEICLGPDGKAAQEVPIRTLTLAELKRYDCGTIRNPRFPRQQPSPGERIPTLDEVFELVEKSTYSAAATEQFNIETKIVPNEPELSPPPAEFARRVLEVVRRHHMEDRTILQSFDSRTLKEMRRLEPRIRLSMLTSDNYVDYVAMAAAVGADIISPDALWIMPADVRDLHKVGVEVAPWTVNDEKSWDGLIAMGVDAIITDDPESLIAHLKKKGLR